MIKNHLKTAWRTMVLNRTYSITNLIGLSLGLVVVMLISSLVLDELSYDRQWTLRDELYRLRSIHSDKDGNVQFRSDGAPSGLGHALAAQFPEVIDYTNINSMTPKLTIDRLSNRYVDLDVLESDTNFFNLFDTQALEGNPKQIVAHAKNLVITESTHRRYFEGEEVIGKLFYSRPDAGEPDPYVINAILRDLPQNTHLHAEAILIVPHHQPFEPDKAGAQQGQYIHIQQGADTATLAAKINEWYTRQQPEQRHGNIAFTFQSIKDIHLRSVTGWDSPMRDIYVLIGIATLILVLACINFVNLTFAHAVKRTLETGIRKVLGANRIHLISQIGAESLLLFGSALAVAFFGYVLVLPAFEKYLGHPLTLTFHRSLPMLAGLLFFWVLLGIFCSLFPALALSKTKATHELKKRLTILNLPLNTGFTKSLIALQFSIAMVVIICMLTIREQLRYMDAKDLGYKPENLLVLDYTQWEGKSQAFKQTLSQHPGITSVSLSQWSPFSGYAEFTEVEDPENPAHKEHIALFRGDFDLINTLGMQLIDGRKLQPNHALDAVTYDSITLQREIYSNVLVTETTAKNLHLELNSASAPLSHTPVGVVKDFHGASLRYPIALMMIEAQREWDAGCMLVRVADGQEKEALEAVIATWNDFFPNRISRINWLEEQIKNQYLNEQKQYQQLAFFSSISMLIALLGVLGIAIYTIECKVKEIGIRKVLGASVGSIVSLLSASFTKLVFVAAALAFPIAWWLMHNWLNNFAYRIEVPLLLFVLTGLFTFCCMLTVVGFKAFRAASANPVESLRDQ
ncbi:ABC transporter permease [Parapedobacter koreensis]|uniref:Putative ABC transport system permease protein n=1 Tax=Parapedobacter koreensis TaxID=332977 RepID=A0A1H7QYT5_9SPHI|nr:ABC transporter permease [Parapedobacter koreensis]SEL53191.1 putative ABC transport system permease protein [Parapedobacter koreensis]